MKKILCLLMALFVFYKANSSQNKILHGAFVEGHFETGNDDTVRLQFLKEKYGTVNIGEELKIQIIHNGRFRFKLENLNGPGYIILSSNSLGEQKQFRLYLDAYIIEEGDSIHIEVKKNGLSFYGKGAEKYRCRYAIDTLQFYDPKAPVKGVTMDEVRQDVKKALDLLGDDHGMTLQLNMLENYKHRIPDLIYQVMKSDIISYWVRQRYNFFAIRWGEAFIFPDSIERKEKLIQFFYQKINLEPEVSAEAKKISCGYPDLTIIKAIMKSKIENNEKELFDCADAYTKLKKVNGVLGEKSIVSFFGLLTEANGISSFDSCLSDALMVIKSEDYRSALISLSNKISKGSEVFPFNLPDAHNGMVSLASLKGKIVLIDFWFTGCDACLSCARQLRKVIQIFSNNDDVVFVSICVDAQISRWKKSLAEDTYASPELEVNLYTNGLGMDHPLLRYYNVESFPTLLLIGADGRLISALPPRPDDFHGVKRLTEMINESLSAVNQKPNGQ